MDLECNLVLDTASLAAGGVDFCTRDVVGGSDLEQRRERLDHAGGATGKGLAPLIEDQRLLRNEIAADGAERAGRDLDQLRVRDVYDVAVVVHGREVRALRGLLHLLVL